ncbi:LysR family transcriptional regulator [Ideonella sp.]|jgi:DNA-binding transcriptional LysR family regulator|uniref:LysR family transcriptional regulator n=1 Tax=Ideonella sp. TaxID=1929293 RepID=UPI0037BF82E0
MSTDLRTLMWSHVHALTVLAEAGSFTTAAQRLGVSKAAMSQRVAELERALAVPLVRRTTRSMQLTEAGLRLVEATRGNFEAIAQAFSGIQELAAEPRGLLRVTAPVALARQHLVDLLPQFLKQYPQVRLELDLSDRLRPLAQEGFDLAIRHTSMPPDTHVAWALRPTRSLLAASPAYLAQRGQPRHPSELSQHACLLYPRPGEASAWSLEPNNGDAAGRVSVAVSGPFAANNSEALREAAVAGLGIALLPDFSAEGALAQGLLVPVLPQWQPVGAFGSQIWAVRPHSAQVPLAVKALVAFLRQAWGAKA